MDGLELICFEIISNAGAAKSNFIEALELVKNQRFDESEVMIKEGEEFLGEAHKAHSQLIMQEGSGKKVEMSLLLMHAEDQLMSVETIKIIMMELINTNKDLQRALV